MHAICIPDEQDKYTDPHSHLTHNDYKWTQNIET
jgi:hypothetical protein